MRFAAIGGRGRECGELDREVQERASEVYSTLRRQVGDRKLNQIEKIKSPDTTGSKGASWAQRGKQQ